ncbi:MAG TPA: T9SS type A sorting domain-containing protein [Chitinophagaceae bacterium]|nr:T9SS type A sorting domain-containing protein [Chitinophagaceae bacterium]
MNPFYRSLLVLLCACTNLVVHAQVPKFNSWPTASATIYLDFDGQTVTGSNWNYEGRPIVCGPSGLDETQMTEVFNRMAEDYRPFNINITTDSTKYWSAPATRRMRVIVTVTSDWYGAVGGTAMVGTFTTGDNTPCFVFSQRLGFNTKKIGEGVSHEAGHTLGLYHQASYDANCNKTSDYNYGQGTGEIGWAPIMGAGYYQNMTLWNNGPNSFGCADYQNDLSIITTDNGFTYRNDDHGNDFATATAITNQNNRFTANGIVERSTDQDVFSFTLPASGRLQLNAIPYNVATSNNGSNLDIQATLYNNAKTIIGVYNPGTLLNSVIDSNMNAGTYYLRIEGKGNAYAPNYASLGSYALQATYSGATVLPLHKLELRGQLTNEKHQLSWEIIADETVVDQQLEVSSDGVHFTVLAQPMSSIRSYIYRPAQSSALQYRLHITLDNGRDYYSNLVTIRGSNSHRPQLIGNMSTNGQLTVSSPGIFTYSVYANNGQMITTGKLLNGMNTIQLPAMHSGIYMIRFNNEEQSWTDKFIRQ